jgi:hypothetical protein
MIDVIVTTGGFFKKHDVFWMEDVKAVWPAYQYVAVAPDSPARGLAIARVFLAHRLDVRIGKASPDSDVFGYASALATWGPVTKAIPVATRSASAYLMQDPRDAEQLFGFEGWSRELGMHVVLSGRLAKAPRSLKKLPYRVVFNHTSRGRARR